MIYVTHDQVEAMTLADRIVVLNGGRVEQIGTPLELYHHPRNLFVAGFIGSPKMNFVTARVTNCDGSKVTIDIDGRSVIVNVSEATNLQPGISVTLGLRPEDLKDADPGEAAIEGEVVAVEHLGSESYIHLAYGGAEPLVFKSTGDTAIKPGQRVSVAVPATACYLFDAQGTAIPRTD